MFKFRHIKGNIFKFLKSRCHISRRQISFFFFKRQTSHISYLYSESKGVEKDIPRNI